MNDLKHVPQCQGSHLRPNSIMERKLLFDGVMAFCKRIKACPACATAAILYAATLPAIKGLNMSKEAFLEAAREIYEDAEKQLQHRVLA